MQTITSDIKYDLYGINNVQPIWADHYFKTISNAKMGLNLSRGQAIKYYSSDRISQMVGNGLLTFVDKKTELNDFFTKHEIIFYNSTSDLADKINKYNKDDKLRIRIAKAGRDKYFKYFNSTLVAEYIINKTFNIDNKNFFWEKK